MDSSIKATIATSIMPRRIEVQQEAIKSWQQLGFNVISVNIEAELAILSPLFKDVHFILSDRTSLKAPLIQISELLDNLKKTESDVCGVVNSDIVLSTGNDFISFLYDMTRDNTLIFGSRAEIYSIGSRSENISTGYDYFFFRHNLPSIALVGDFHIGETWWDYWLPISFAIHDIQLCYLIFPVGFHTYHIQDWNEHDLECGKQKFISAITITWARSSSSSALSTKSNLIMKQQGAKALADIVRSVILLDSKLINHGVQTIPLEQLPVIMNALMPHLESYERLLRSKSWRWTAPVRNLIKLVT